MADERERIADQREALADERELIADERERIADERDRELEVNDVVSSPSGHVAERAERVEPGVQRRHEAALRSQAEVKRE